jgi:hypothetical protein
VIDVEQLRIGTGIHAPHHLERLGVDDVELIVVAGADKHLL